MVGVPQQHMMLQHVDPFTLLNGLPQIMIEEKMNLLQTATGLLGEVLGFDGELEMANKYVPTLFRPHVEVLRPPAEQFEGYRFFPYIFV